MKPPLHKTLMLAAVLATGANHLPAAEPLATEEKLPVDGDLSLLGQVFGTLTYSYINLDGSSVHADNYALEMNQPLAFGFDGILVYDYAQTGAIAGSRLKQQVLSGALRAFSTSYNWGKPYVEAGGGFAWSRHAGASDKSFLWEVGAGAEFQVSSRATVTPYVQYADAPDLPVDGMWNFGVKSSYWIDAAWAVTTGIERDNEQNLAFTVGTNFRY